MARDCIPSKSKVELLSVRKKINVEFFSDLSRPSTFIKSKTAHFYLQPLFNALNMLSALRLTYLTCCVGK